MASHILEKWIERMCTKKQHTFCLCLSIYRKWIYFLVAANSTFFQPFNWPLKWSFWSDFLTEGVVFHEELGNAKKPKPKCVRVLWNPKCVFVTFPLFGNCNADAHNVSVIFRQFVIGTYIFVVVSEPPRHPVVSHSTATSPASEAPTSATVT